MMTELLETFYMASTSLLAHKLRSVLTLLGIMVGVFSIIVVMTTMRAMQKYIELNLGSLGGETFVVSKWPSFHTDNSSKYWNRKDITFDQGLKLMQKVTLPKYIGMEQSFSVEAVTSAYGQAAPNFQFKGETPGSVDAQNCVLSEGRAFSQDDVQSHRNCCVLGSQMARDLFPFGSALDQQIKIGNLRYSVIGVLDPMGSMSGGTQDNFLMVPLTTGFEHYGNNRLNVNILVTAPSRGAFDDTVEQVSSILRVLRKVPAGVENDFEINSNDATLDSINKFTFTVRAGISAVSSIALVAAGIGIMNIMLVSVTERTREIGIRRAIGARKRSIMLQFIIEAVFLCELGGVAGVVMGVFAGNVAAHFLHLTAVFPIDWALFGLLVCSLVGIVFGVYPAYKAANLDPIESLRYE